MIFSFSAASCGKLKWSAFKYIWRESSGHRGYGMCLLDIALCYRKEPKMKNSINQSINQSINWCICMTAQKLD